MKILIVLLILVFLSVLTLLTYLLIAPIKIRVDSEEELIWLGWNNWLNARLSKATDCGVLIRVPGWKKLYKTEELARLGGKQSGKEMKRKQRKRAKKHSISNGLVLEDLLRMIRSIRITELRINMDTGDYIWNAWLVPVVSGIRWYTGHDTRVNFIGKQEFRLVAEVKAVNLLWNWLRPRFSNIN